MAEDKPTVLDQRFSVDLALRIARQVVREGRGNVNIVIINQPQGVQLTSDNSQKLAISKNDNPLGTENFAQNIEDVEVYLLKRAVDMSNGVKAQAARLLGMKRSTFYEKCQKYGIGETTEG